jgi:hypothetical protein
MKYERQFWRWIGVLLSTITVLTGCTYDAAVQRLSLAEQSEFHTYSKVMTRSQERTYLAKATAAERTAYLSQIGLAQRFQALDPLDRDLVLSGMPQVGMSAEALRFIWGDPYYAAGDARHHAHWHYLGSSLALGESGNRYRDSSSRVDVYLVAGHIVGWVDHSPNSDGGEDSTRR